MDGSSSSRGIGGGWGIMPIARSAAGGHTDSGEIEIDSIQRKSRQQIWSEAWIH